MEIWLTAVSTLAKVSKIMPMTVTRDSHYNTWLGNLGWYDANRNDPISITPQSGQDKYSQVMSIVAIVNGFSQQTWPM
jgi:hypothetical protein